MMTSRRLIAETVLIAGLIAGVSAQNAPSTSSGQAGPDWPQWRGPRRDGTLTAFTAPATWPDALKQQWKITVGEGYATPILVGNRVYQFSRQGENEVMRSIDAATGKVIWEKSYAAPFEMTSGTRRHGPGPKSTPTYADGRIFTLGMSSIVTAWDAATGKELWRIPSGPLQPQFHTAMSPLVDRNQMFLHLGGDKQGSLNSFDPATGKIRWSWTGDGPAYGSPIIAEIGGTRHLMLFSQQNLISVNPDTGALLWSVPFESRSTTNSITPLVYGGNMVIVSGQGKPLTAYIVANKAGKWVADLAWENPQIGMSFSNAVLVGDAVFSMSPLNSGQFFWADAKTGKTLWLSEPRQGGNAAITRSGDLLFILKETGELLVGKGTPGTAFTPAKTYTVATSATWAPPVISGNRIFVKDAESPAEREHVKILFITAGAAGMYCGSCLRDNALAAELKSRGHDVVLVPLYTPTRTDEPNVSETRVLFGGISVYLQQKARFFRWAPRILDTLLDAPWLIRAAASGSMSTDPRSLGELTISMLKGEDGFQRREFEKMLEWLSTEPAPDVVQLPNALLASLAPPIRRALKAPVHCTLQGEDLFLDGLTPYHRSAALDLIRRNAESVDRFTAVSEYYADFMAGYLSIPRGKIDVVPLGINLEGFERASSAEQRPFTVGYLARIAPEKGLLALCDAYVKFRSMPGVQSARLEVAGYLAADQHKYLKDAERRMSNAGFSSEFRYRGALDRQEKIAFLQGLDAFSVPTSYVEPKGLFLIEAMAAGVPVVQPRHGAFPEMLAKTSGGILVDPGQTQSLADGLYSLWKDPALRAELGRKGSEGVRAHYSVRTSADRMLEVYERSMCSR